MSRISPSEQKNQALREMFEQRFEASAERDLMLSELIRLTTEKTLQEMLELEQRNIWVGNVMCVERRRRRLIAESRADQQGIVCTAIEARC